MTARKTMMTVLASLPLLLVQCSADNPGTVRPQEEKPQERISFRYHYLALKDSGKAVLKRFAPEHRVLLFALNRMDAANGSRADTLVVPDTLLPDIMAYSPFPAQAPFLKDVRKLICFSYPAQAFGAYEHGKLVRWGPTSMGRKKDPTPTGLYFCNWKAEETISTFDDEWKLKWNFNIENKLGVGWHQYVMPGYPASHSCLRLLEKDARYLYDWGEQWIVEGENTVIAQGTPVIVFGAYPFGGRKPWRELPQDPAALDISPEVLQKETEQFLPRILQQQRRRDTVVKAAAAESDPAEK